jgi:hypothetical protein
MSTSNPAPPTKLILCQPLGHGCRLVTEIGPDNGDERPAVTVTCWKDSADGAQQQSRAVKVLARLIPAISAFAAAVRRAVAER